MRTKAAVFHSRIVRALLCSIALFSVGCAGEGGGTVGTLPDPGTTQPDAATPDVQTDTPVATDTPSSDITDAPTLPPCEPASSVTCGSFEETIQPILTTGCSVGGCHSTEFGLTPSMGLDLSEGLSHAAMVNVAAVQAPELMLIAPGDPEGSYLVHKVQNTQSFGSAMPQGTDGLTQDEVDALTNWIQACAPAGSYGDCPTPDVVTSDVAEDTTTDGGSDVVEPDVAPDPGPATDVAQDTGPVDMTPDPGPPVDMNPPDVGPPPTFAQIQSQILDKYCTPCHTDSPCSSNDCLVDSHDEMEKSAGSCGGLPMYECSLNRILSGSMPRQKGCTGNPSLDQGNSDCLNAQELQLFTDWVNAGGPE